MENQPVFPAEVASGALAGTFPPRQGSRGSVRQIMTQDVPAVGPGFDAAAIADLLLAHDAGGLPVVRSERLVGFITLADAAREALECADGTPQGSLRLSGPKGVTYPTGPGFHAVSGPARARDMMLPASLALSPDTSIPVAAATLANHRLAALPVVEEDGHLAGVISALDILRWLAREHGLPVGGGEPFHRESV